MLIFKTVLRKRVEDSMQIGKLHYGDILKKVERVIESCQTTDQLGAAWRYADLFEEHCSKAGVNDQTRMIMRSNVNHLLEDRFETIRLEKCKNFENGESGN